MKILHLVPELNLGCGVSASVYSATEAMKDKNHNVFIITDHIDEYYKDKLKKLDVYYELAPLAQTKKNIIHFIASANVVNRLVKKENIEIIHSHHRWNCLIGTVCAKICGIKSLTSDHNILYGRRLLSFWADGIITDSAYNKDHLIKYFHILDNKIKIIPPLIEKDRYKKLISKNYFKGPENNEFKIFKHDDELLIGQIARLSEEKGQGYLLDVIYEVVNKCKNIKFLFMGEGPLKNKLLKKVESLELSEKVYFLGQRDNVLDFLAVLDIMVFSSNREGFCIAAAEAILSGLPVVATNVGGLPEQIKDGVTGFLIDLHDKKSYVEKLVFLLQNPKMLKEMGGRGKSYFLDKYSYEKISKLLEETYRYYISK